MIKRYIFICGVAKGTPIWMYYVRYLLTFVESIINLFTLPFHIQVDISISWMAHMLRGGLKRMKQHNLEDRGDRK